MSIQRPEIKKYLSFQTLRFLDKAIMDKLDKSAHLTNCVSVGVLYEHKNDWYSFTKKFSVLFCECIGDLVLRSIKC